MIKRLAETNLVAGDYPAAMKYLRILDKTIAYRLWAAANRPNADGHLRSLTLNDKRQYALKDDTLRTRVLEDVRGIVASHNTLVGAVVDTH